jgi:hypothetical protein
VNNLKGGGSKNQTTTSSSEPPKYLQPYLNYGVSEAKNLYGQGPQQYYPGQTVVGFSPETEAALGMTTNRANSGSPVMAAGNNYAAGVLGTSPTSQFGSATNPYLDSMFNQAANSTQTRLASEFAGSGRNIEASRPARAEELNNLATNLYGGAYEGGQNRMASDLANQRGIQLGVLNQAPQLAQADYYDIDRLRGVGQTREDLTGRQYEDAAARFDFEQAAPGNSLDQYLARLQGYPGGASSTSTPIYRNTAAGAAGGAMAGYGIGSQFGYGGWGALLGGLLGAAG